MAFIRSISGIRATEGDGLNISVLSEYLISFGNLYGQGGIVFGRDGRSSGFWLEKLLMTAFESLGIPYLNIGIAPTPTIMLMVEKFGFTGGISITASHNPSQWNGLKFINSTGVFLNQDENNKLWNLVDNKIYSLNKIETKINTQVENLINNTNFDALDFHNSEILNLPLIKDNLQELKNYFKSVNFKVVVDAVNSSGSIIVPNLLKALDIEVIELFCDQTKGFPHTPEPLTENLTELINEVKNQKANLGLAIDPDSDRLVIIGENGEAIGEENTIVLSVFAILNNLKNSNLNTNINIVVNGSTTSMVEKVADKFGSKVIRSAVGEINVVEMMKLHNAIIGGEGSGGVILPELHYSRDAVIGIVLILSLIYNQKKSVNAIVEDLGKSIMKKDKMEFTGSLDSIITKIEKEFNGNEIIIGDGIKIYTNKYEWVQLRKSNTEPIIRIIAESDNKETTDKLMKKVKNIFSESL